MTSNNSLTSRRLTVSTPTTLTWLPAGWPAELMREEESIRIDPPAELEPGKRYRLLIDHENRTATITEES